MDLNPSPAVVEFGESRRCRCKADLLHRSQSTALRDLERYRAIGGNRRRPGSGRGSVTNAVEDSFESLEHFETALLYGEG